MKRSVSACLVALAAAAALAACGEPASGEVTELEYEPASSFTSYSCVTRYNSKGQYAGQTCTPYTTYVPECWDVDYYDAETDTEGDECVSQSLFDALNIGDDFWKGMTVDDVA